MPGGDRAADPNWIASKWCFAELVWRGSVVRPSFWSRSRPATRSGSLRRSPADRPHHQTGGGVRTAEKRPAGIAGSIRCKAFDLALGRPPYPGFMAFDEDDAAIFFGRGTTSARRSRPSTRCAARGVRPLRSCCCSAPRAVASPRLCGRASFPRLRKQPAQWLPSSVSARARPPRPSSRCPWPPRSDKLETAP